MTIVWFLLAGSVLALGASWWTNWKIERLRRAGIYPFKGRASDEDVARLIDLGMPEYAIRCHREVHHTSLKNARDAVYELIRIRSSAVDDQTADSARR